jgi:phasin family protein
MPFEKAAEFGKEYMDNGLKSFASLSRGVQAIAIETTDYVKRSVEQSTQATEKLLGAKSLDKAFEVQTDYAKQAYEGFVAEMTKLGEMYADLAKEAYKPFETAVAKVK